MAVRDQAYPFRPSSNRSVRSGQFWALPLREGWFGCGRVLDLPEGSFPGQRTMFLAGLIDWFGLEPPSAESIAGAPLLAVGSTHIKCVQETGGMILGHRSLEADGIVLPRFVDAPGPDPGVYEGLRWIGHADRREMLELPRCPVWGFLMIQIKAQQRWQEVRAAAQAED